MPQPQHCMTDWKNFTSGSLDIKTFYLNKGPRFTGLKDKVENFIRLDCHTSITNTTTTGTDSPFTTHHSPLYCDL